MLNVEEQNWMCDNTNYEYRQEQDAYEKRQKSFDEPLKEYKSLLYLKKTVKKTRVNRISAANRLLSTERFLQWINIYYSCYSACITILGLITPNKSLAIVSTILTVILAISIVFLNAQKYGNRSQELKNNYISLHYLLYEIELAEARNDVTKLEEFMKRYCELLQTSENHSDLDYLRNKSSCEKLVWYERVRFYTELLFVYGLRTILVLLPIVITILLIYINAFAEVFC
jgi:hypothetical protein